MVSEVFDETAQQKLLTPSPFEERGSASVAGVVHELRNALGVIIGGLDLVLRSPLSPHEIEQQIQMVMNAAERAISITEQL